ncbi:MAG: dihydrodipicolinate synthase family protein [Azospirillaceae bacterium]
MSGAAWLPDPKGPKLRGIVPSLNTPFNGDGAIEEAGVARLVEHCVATGCPGALALAVAGEVGALTAAERARLTRLLEEASAGRLALVIGCSAPDFADSLAAARTVREAAAVLWQAPADATAGDLVEAVGRLSDAAGGRPVIVQDLDWAGPGLALDAIVEAAARAPAFAGIKIETVPAGPKYSAVRAALGDRLNISGGWAVAQMLDGLARGVDAFVPTGMEPVYVAIHDRFARGDADGARALFEALLPVIAFANQHIHVSIRTFKRLRAATGTFATDHCRPPVPPLDPIQAAEADRAVARALALERDVVAGRQPLATSTEPAR